MHLDLSFAASGLDRAAHLRRDDAALAAALTEGAPVLVFWRGKLLTAGDEGGMQAVPVRADARLLAQAGGRHLFLGAGEDGRLWFAADISAWEPDSADTDALGAFLDPSVQIHPDAPDGSGFRELRGIMTLLPGRHAELAATAKAVLGWHDSHRFCSACGTQSDWHEAGWQRQCPACGTRHFPRTDPVVIMLVTHGNSVLLGRSPGWPEGMYSLLAGFVEPGETLEAATAREVLEETGVETGPVHYVACQPWPFPSSLMIGTKTEATSTKITLDPEELDDAIWVPREDVATAIAGDHPTLKPARQGAIARYMLDMWLRGEA